MNSNRFGGYLNSKRKSKNMTLEALGTKVGLSKSYLSHIENGRREPPSPEILGKIAEALGISYEELMIKAGYWKEHYDEQDRDTFEKIYNEEAEMLDRIRFVLTKLTDEEGEFPDDLHREIYQIFGGWLPRQYDGMWDFDDCFNDDLNHDDEMSESIADIHNEFNLAFNPKNIMKGLKEYNGFYKSLEDVLNDLIELADKAGYEIGERKSLFTEIDLSEILPDISIILKFNNKLISEKSRHQLIGYLEALSTIDQIMGKDS